MHKLISLKNPDGTVSVINPAPAILNPESRDRVDLAKKGVLAVDATEKEVYDFVIKMSVPNYRSKMLDGETEEQAKARFNVDDLDKYIEHRFIDKNDLPKDRFFRNAWTDDNPTQTVDVHLGKAKLLKLDMLREVRKPKFEKLDVEQITAIVKDDKVKVNQIEGIKQLLRDVTDLPLPDDLEQLKDFMPDVLKEGV